MARGKGAAKYVLALLTGAGLILSFPPFSHTWLIFIALAPLLAALDGARPKQAFFLGWLAGTVFFAGLCYWVGFYGILPLIIMAAGIGACFGLAAWAAATTTRCQNPTLAILSIPLIWVAIEVMRSEGGMYAFPYGVFGYALAGSPAALALAGYLGVYAVSFIAVTANVLVWQIIISLRRGAKTRGLVYLAVFLAGTAAFCLIGTAAGSPTDNGTASAFKAAIVQAVVPQDEKWLSSKTEEIMDKYEKLVFQAASRDPDLIILPEAALPAYIYEGDPLERRLAGWARRTGIPMVAGVPSLSKAGARNTAVLYDSTGRAAGVYAKNVPTLFGEFIPARSISELIYPPLVHMGDITPGTSAGVFAGTIGGRETKLGVLICSESMYSNLARETAQAGVDALVVITNDAWFFDSNEAALHFDMTAMRAAETGKTVAQAANTGISGVSSPDGRRSGVIELDQTGVSTANVGRRRDSAFHARFGWLFAYAVYSAGLAIMVFCYFVNVCVSALDEGII